MRQLYIDDISLRGALIKTYQCCHASRFCVQDKQALQMSARHSCSSLSITCGLGIMSARHLGFENDDAAKRADNNKFNAIKLVSNLLPICRAGASCWSPWSRWPPALAMHVQCVHDCIQAVPHHCRAAIKTSQPLQS